MSEGRTRGTWDLTKWTNVVQLINWLVNNIKD